jgi:hypothetical protein
MQMLNMMLLKGGKQEDYSLSFQGHSRTSAPAEVGYLNTQTLPTYGNVERLNVSFCR